MPDRFKAATASTSWSRRRRLRCRLRSRMNAKIVARVGRQAGEPATSVEGDEQRGRHPAVVGDLDQREPVRVGQEVLRAEPKPAIPVAVRSYACSLKFVDGIVEVRIGQDEAVRAGHRPGQQAKGGCGKPLSGCRRLSQQGPHRLDPIHGRQHGRPMGLPAKQHHPSQGNGSVTGGSAGGR